MLDYGCGWPRLLPTAVRSQPLEYVITFDNVAVRGIDTVDTPELVHRDLSVLDSSAEGGADRPKRTERTAGSPAKAEEIAGDRMKKAMHRLPYCPRSLCGFPGLSYRMSLARVQATQASSKRFSHRGILGAQNRLAGGILQARPLSSAGSLDRIRGQHLGNPTELHGIYIRSLDGKRFGVKSLRYRVTRNRQMPGKPSASRASTISMSMPSWPDRSIRGCRFAPSSCRFPLGSPWGTSRIFPGGRCALPVSS